MVLNEACRQIADWQAQKSQHRCRVAINFSAFQFRRASLVPGVAAAFARHGVKPQQLEIELTENAIMQDPKETAKTLDQLHDMGVSLSIDDFAPDIPA